MLTALCIGAVYGLSSPVAAQTSAHFVGTSRTLGSGFNHPYGAAVDGSGNIFVADTLNNAVKEILAVGG